MKKESSTGTNQGSRHNQKQQKDISGIKLFLNIVLLLAFVAASVIFSQVALGYLLVWTLGFNELNKPIWVAIYSALSYGAAMILIILVPLSSRKKSARANKEVLGMKGFLTWTDIGLAPVGFVVYLLLAAGLVGIFNLFPWFDAEQAQEIGFSVLSSGLDRVVAFLTLVVLTPIAEEIIFRGFLYGKLRLKLLEKISNRASMIISIVLVSLLFGIMHLSAESIRRLTGNLPC